MAGIVESLAFDFLVLGKVIRAQRFGDAVFLAEPFAEIDQLAAGGAKGPQRVGVEVVLAAAGGAFD